jgi:hypothetical protein
MNDDTNKNQNSNGENVPSSGGQLDALVRQCEKNGEVCGSQEPYPDHIMAGGVICGGCGRRRPNIKYIRASA